MRRLALAVMEASLRVRNTLKMVWPGTLCTIVPVLCFITASLFPEHVRAQAADTRNSATPAPTVQGAPGTGSRDELQEVVVTAQFRQESAQQTPLAITARR